MKKAACLSPLCCNGECSNLHFNLNSFLFIEIAEHFNDVDVERSGSFDMTDLGVGEVGLSGEFFLGEFAG
jgi:hypothetical protein